MSDLYVLRKGVASLFDLVDGYLSTNYAMDAESRVYYADVNRGNASNSGLSKQNPSSTIARMVTAMNARIDWADSPWARHDVLVLAPGTYAENLTSLPYGATVVGLGYDLRDAQNGVKIKPASGVPVDVNACINTTFINICFETAATGAGAAVFDAAICNNNTFISCRFSGPAETATAVGFVTNDAVGNKFLDCEFDCLDKGIDVNYADANDSFSHNLIRDCRFTQIDTAGIEISTNLVGPSSLIERCLFYGAGQTMAIGVDDNAGILDLTDLYITATDPIQGCRSANGCYGNGSLLGGSGE